MKRRRLGALALLTAGASTLVAGLVGMTAAHGEASLTGYSITARAPGFEVMEDEPSATAHPEGQGTIGEATAILSTDTGYALSTIAWPGPTFANGGTLLIVLGDGKVPGGVPQQATALNDPAKAEARAGQGSPDATFGVPGTTLTAHADPAKSEAVAEINATESPAGTFGSQSSHSTSTLDGTKGKATATSRITDITFAGVIKIGSVTSTAEATTDGTTAKGSGSTTFSNVTVGGQSAVIDQTGIHAGPAGYPASATANQIINQSLAKAGVTATVIGPSGSGKDGAYDSRAGSVLFTWIPPNNPSANVFTLVLGGATAQVEATPGIDTGAPLADTTGTFDAGLTAPADTGASTDTGGSSSEAALPAEPSATPAPSRAAPAVGGTALPLKPIGVFKGIKLGWGVLALLGAGMLTVGFLRLGSVALADTTTVCTLEDPGDLVP